MGANSNLFLRLFTRRTESTTKKRSELGVVWCLVSVMTEVKSKEGNKNEGIQKYYVTKIEENQVSIYNLSGLCLEFLVP